MLLALDIGLAFILWQGSREGEQSLRAQRDRLQTQEKLLQADVQRGRKIRASLPQVGKGLRRLLSREFSQSGKRHIHPLNPDLDAIAQKAGLRTSGISFKRTALKDHGVTEISMTASVEGSYSSIIQFINGLEQSKNFYLLNDLRLDSGTTGAIRLKLELLTYSRT